MDDEAWEAEARRVSPELTAWLRTSLAEHYGIRAIGESAMLSAGVFRMATVNHGEVVVRRHGFVANGMILPNERSGALVYREEAMPLHDLRRAIDHERVLRSEGVSLPERLLNRDGRGLVVLAEPSEAVAVSVQQWVEPDAHEPTVEGWARYVEGIGEELAKVHVSTLEVAPMKPRNRGASSVTDELARQLRDRGADDALVARVQSLRPSIELIARSDSVGASMVADLHGDPGLWNMVRHEGRPVLIDCGHREARSPSIST
jgi:hypothetical protein